MFSNRILARNFISLLYYIRFVVITILSITVLLFYDIILISIRDYVEKHWKLTRLSGDKDCVRPDASFFDSRE